MTAEKDFIFQRFPVAQKHYRKEGSATHKDFCTFPELEIGDIFITPYTKQRYIKLDARYVQMMGMSATFAGVGMKFCKKITDLETLHTEM